jgi:hypothetical protein
MGGCKVTLLESMTEDQRKMYDEHLEQLKYAKTVKEVRLLSSEIHNLLDELEKNK